MKKLALLILLLASPSYAALGDKTVIGTTTDLVPKTTKVSGKALLGDITLNAADVGAVSTTAFNSYSTATQGKLDLKLNTAVFNSYTSVERVPATRTVNGQALTGDVTITTITGNAGTATALQTGRTINGVSFDGTANITVADATKVTLAGTAGGQTINGGTAAGETLTLSSAAHATKGKILFGTSAYDEVNNRLGVGTASPGAKITMEAGAGIVGQSIKKTAGADDYLQFIDSAGAKQLYVDYTGQLSFNVASGPIYFGNFYNPGGGLAGFSKPGVVMMGIAASLVRVGFGGTGAHFAIYAPNALLEVRGKADEVQLNVEGNATQTSDIVTVKKSDGTLLFNISNLGNIGIINQITSSLATGTSPFAVTSTTKNTNLNADMLDGLHSTDVPNIKQNVSLTAQVSAIGTTAITGTNTAGLYRVSYSLLDTTADLTAGTIMVNFTGTDEAGAFTMSSVALPLTALGRTQGTFFLRILGTGSVSYSTTLVGIIGASQYGLFISAEKIL